MEPIKIIAKNQLSIKTDKKIIFQSYNTIVCEISNFDNKKAMAKYEKAMAQYEKKMKALEPKMKEFEKKMEAFEKEMKLKEPDMKQFEEEMKVFEEKMKVFEKEMEVYQKKLEASTEYYINGEKVTKEEVDKIQPNEIKSVNVRKNNTPKRIEIKKVK